MLLNRTFARALLGLCPAMLIAQNVITTIAGVDPSFTGNGEAAVDVPIGYINGVASDEAGNVYFTDPIEHLLMRVSTKGLLTVVAGNGIAAYSGDGGPATSAAIGEADNPDQYVGAIFEDSLGGVALDKQGNIYFADGHRVRRVTAADGTITTVAGGGAQSPGDGGLATAASLGIVNGLAFDAAGDLYFCENNRIRRMTPDGTLSTFAGGNANGFAGDGGPAIAALLSQPEGLAFDAQGDLFVADGDVVNFPSRIREISVNGNISTIAGGGNTVPANGVAPLQLNLAYASGLAVDASNALYIFAPKNGYLLKISGGMTTLITKTTSAAFKVNIPAINAYVVGQRVYDNSGIALDALGNLYVADSRDGRLCKIASNGILTSLAGNGLYGMGGDGGPALGAMIQGPSAMAETPDGTLYFLDTLNARVRGIAPGGVINTIISAANFPPLGVNEVLNAILADPNGNVYVLLSHRLLKYTAASNSIQVLLNTAGSGGSSGDGGPATLASLESGGGLARDSAGNIYISDPAANQIRKVDASGMISTIAGTGVSGVSPDNSVAATSPIAGSTSLLADNQGGLYFEEAQTGTSGGFVIRYITPGGLLQTFAGNGKGGFTGDGGPAAQAGLALQNRAGLAFDASGNLYIADGFNHRVRVVTNGIINSFAGNGTPTTSGDGGAANHAGFSIPRGLLFDAHGNLLISDVAGNRIREVLGAPPAITVAPSSINFNAESAGAMTAPQELTINSPVSGVAFTVTSSADWLIVGAGGLTPRLLGVRVDPTNLVPGPYQGTITVTAQLATPVTSTVQVSLIVSPGRPPVLETDKSSLTYTFPRIARSTEIQIVKLTNAGSGSISFTAEAQTIPGHNWLSFVTASGTVTPQKATTVAVLADPTGLVPGTYSGSVTFASSNAGNIVIPVTLTVSSRDQAIQLSRPGLAFTAVANGGVVPAGTFSVANIGNGAMNFAVSTQTLSGGPWLSATSSSGTATAGQTPVTVRVSADQTGLAPGIYFGLVRIDAPDAANSPHVVTVAMQVLASGQDPGPVIEPSEITFTTQQGAPPPGSRNLFVYNISATPQTYVASVTSANAGDGVSFSPGNATLSLDARTRIVVQPLTSGLAPGVYRSDLTLHFSDGIVRRVGISTIVTPASTSPHASSGDDPHAASVCAPTQLVPTITTLGQTFSVPAAWPVALEAQVTDDCGNPFTAGDVTATFSNGDPALSLLSIQDGTWQSTWLSGSNGGQVTITVTANDARRTLTGTDQITGGLGSVPVAPVLGSAVSAASFAASAPLSPGSLISLFGANLGNGTAQASALPLGTTLADAQVAMAGVELPLLYGSAGQINAQVSAGINVNTSQQILVQRGHTLSLPSSVNVAPASPAIFPYAAAGDPPQQGAIVNAITYAVADPKTPVTTGDVVAIFCTGLGAVDQPVADGAAAPNAPLARTVVPATVTIGGKPANVSFSGLSPGFVGLYQIDATVPAGVAANDAAPVVVSIVDQSSPAATIAVK